MGYVNINGTITVERNATLPVDNGAFRYGYGIFESMLVQEGEILLEAYHWERLFTGAKILRFELPGFITKAWFREQVLKTVEKNGLEQLCRVRLQLFAGGGGLYDMKSMQPGVVIECLPLEFSSLALNENGLVMGIATGVAKSANIFANLKTCNCLVSALAAHQAKDNKWNDALLCNTTGNIIESTIANIFWIKGTQLYTPPLSDGCIAGVTRQYIIDNAPVTETPLTETELYSADEVFLTNAVKRIRWIGAIGPARYRNDQTVLLSQRLFLLEKS